MKPVIIVVAGMLAVAGLASSHAAHAAGCLRGAVVGGVAGHYMGHHGLLGAGAGCLYERHEANKRFREQREMDPGW